MSEGSERYAKHPGRGGFTNDYLINVLQTVFKEYGIVPSTRDCDTGRYGLPSAKVFTRAFGSLDEAKVQAGIVAGSATLQKTLSPAKTHQRGHL